MESSYQVVLSPEAQKQLKNIYVYLTDAASTTTAELVKDALLLEIENLSEMPYSKGLLKGVISDTEYRRC